MIKNKNTNSNCNTSEYLPRFIFIAIIFAVMIMVIVLRLFNLQILNHADYLEQSKLRTGITETVSSVRGEIYDRNGKPLVSNQVISNIVLKYSKTDFSQLNDILVKFLKLAESFGYEIENVLPFDTSNPHVLNLNDDNRKLFNSFLERTYTSEKQFESISFYSYLCERYGINIDESANPEKDFLVMSVRYKIDASAFGYNNDFVLIENASDDICLAASDLFFDLPCISVGISAKRVYNQGSLACHILGTLGPIYPEEAEYYLEKGYSYDSLVGKDGIEKAFEDYLRGIDGKRIVSYDASGNVINYEITTEPQEAYSVRLTIDSDMQKVAENSLSQVIKDIGIDGISGSVAVIDPNNFEVLTLASYPSYDLNTYRENYSYLASDEVNRPLYNRATNGIYPPGSTFKIVTALAALGSGIIDSNTLVYDKGIYKKYQQYQPHCWIYDSEGITHGYVSVVGAIKESCNYFFYEVSDSLGIDAIVNYAEVL